MHSSSLAFALWPATVFLSNSLMLFVQACASKKHTWIICVCVCVHVCVCVLTSHRRKSQVAALWYGLIKLPDLEVLKAPSAYTLKCSPLAVSLFLSQTHTHTHTHRHTHHHPQDYCGAIFMINHNSSREKFITCCLLPSCANTHSCEHTHDQRGRKKDKNAHINTVLPSAS